MIRFVLPVVLLATSCKVPVQDHRIEPQRDNVVSQPQKATAPEGGTSSEIEVHFSPGSECETAYVQKIDSAKKSIEVQAYSFTSVAIANALIRAHNRGVVVTVVLDKEDLKAKSEALDLKAAGIPTWIDSKHPIAHNKVLILDQDIVLTGSYNLTNQARSNAENCLVISNTYVAGEYEQNFQRHLAHSPAY